MQIFHHNFYVSVLEKIEDYNKSQHIKIAWTLAEHEEKLKTNFHH